MKNKKLIGIIVAVLGLVLIIFGCLFLSSGNKIKDPTIDIKDFTINNEIVTKVGDSLLVSNGQKYGYYDMNGRRFLMLLIHLIGIITSMLLMQKKDYM